jgi:hypothetical protein
VKAGSHTTGGAPPADPSRERTTFDDVRYALSYAPGVEKHYWNYARNRIVSRNVRRTLTRMRDPGLLVLDVGCGTGITVGHLRAEGIDCHGVELGRPQIRPGVEAFVTTGTDARHLDESVRERVGVILLLDVVEHIEDAPAFLCGLRDAFPRLEHFLITVPARKELWSNYDEFYGHFLRFDRNDVAELARRAGLEVSSSRYFFQALYLPALAITRARGTRALETPPPRAAMRPVHAVIGTGLAMLERVPLLGAVPGTSLMATLSLSR